MYGDLERFVLAADRLSCRPRDCRGGHCRHASELCPAISEEAQLVSEGEGVGGGLDTHLSLVSIGVRTLPVDGLGESHWPSAMKM